jgi:hypothetical protein
MGGMVMKRKFIKWLIAIAVIGVAILSPFIGTNKVEVKTYETKTVEKRIDYAEVVTEALEKINKLEILQSSMKEEVEIKAKWDNFLFKNTQLIQIRGNGIYKLDLDKFEVITACNEATIIADIETSVEIYDIKEQTEKGWLVMYDREFTSQEYSDMIFKVKDKMKSEMQDEANLKVAKERAEEIIKTKVKEKGVFNVKVIWR